LHTRAADPSWILAVPLGLLVAILALALVAPIVGSLEPGPRVYGEGWNAYHQLRVMQGAALYDAPPALTIVNYPPLSFHLVAWGAGLGGVEPLLVGRGLSLLAFAAAAALVGVGAWQFGAGRAMAGCAALTFAITGAIVVPHYIGSDEPHLLGLAFSLGGLVAFLGARSRAAWLALSGALFAAAVAVKLNFVAIPLALGLHLVLARAWGDLIRWVAFGLVASLPLLAWTLLLEGPHAVAHLLFARKLSVWVLLTNVNLGLQNLASLFLASGVLLALGLALGAPRLGLLATLCGVPFALALFFALGNGVAVNIFLETIACMAIACFVILDGFARSSRGAPVAMALVAAAALLPSASAHGQIPARLWEAWRGAPDRAAQAAAAAEMAALLARLDGPVVCEDLLLCLRAGKPIVYDPYFVDDQIRVGRLPAEGVAALFAERRYAAVQLGVDVPVVLEPGVAMLRFPAPVTEALRGAYAPGQAYRGRLLLLLPAEGHATTRPEAR
jgi:hypothetical protein